MAERVFNLPDLGEGLEDAEIVEWKVAPGDDVELNRPLVEVNTAKALVEIPSPFAGRVTTLHGEAGGVVAVGQPLVTFEVETGAPPSAEGEAAAAAGQASPGDAARPKREAVLVGYGVGQEKTGRRRPRLRPPDRRDEGNEARATPLVRRLAREKGIDLTSLRGSGPDGRLTRDDVLKAATKTGARATAETSPEGAPHTTPGEVDAAVAPSNAAAPRRGEEERVAVRGVRRLIAQKMARSWREIPHVTTFHTVDATHVEALRRELTEESGTKVSALSVVVRALAEVCRRHPKLNASFHPDAGEIVLKGSYHVGIAADSERGLLVPVVRDVDAKGITRVARELAEVVEAARAGRATPDQLTGSTITVTNFGVFGSEAGTPIINHPEAAILGTGRIADRAVVIDGQVEVRPTLTLALSFDHRVLDGADADRAMTDLTRLLESPFRLGALPR
ncbi:MAG TPA: dihydrolipoamide acetyltransferase family protein [Actinomycetota bacterium]|jgi:pyruvate dehydrogenase E2 component (dihydrolipoamide acetyltransferase)|nr:dihydrolipoamide acetyltransferase family protein [Actinomycetota bacterium]